MSKFQRLQGAALASLMLVAACAKPPTQEMADAENAVKAAIQAGAKDYAPDEIGMAEAAWADTQSKVAGKDYKGAKAAALDTKAKAEAAGTAAATNIKAAQGQAEQTMASLKPQLEALQTEVGALKGKGLDQIKADAASLAEGWQGVESDFTGGQFRTVLQKLGELQTRMDALKTSIEDAKKAAAKPSKKKRK